MNIENKSQEVKEIMMKSGDMTKCEQVYELSQKLCESENICMTDAQKLSVLSHLSAMVYRSLTGEKLAPIDQELFAGISSKSLEMARKVKESLNNLEENEVYLLSIHFEVAKQNS